MALLCIPVTEFVSFAFYNPYIYVPFSIFLSPLSFYLLPANCMLISYTYMISTRTFCLSVLKNTSKEGRKLVRLPTYSEALLCKKHVAGSRSTLYKRCGTHNSPSIDSLVVNGSTLKIVDVFIVGDCSTQFCSTGIYLWLGLIIISISVVKGIYIISYYHNYHNAAKLLKIPCIYIRINESGPVLLMP